jgi:GntR family transcriptional regulator
MPAGLPAFAQAATPLTAESLDVNAVAPLYRQVFLLLREEIRRGHYRAGDLLPGEQELTKLFGLSRITVKRALNELASQGLVARQRGRGTVVTYNPAAPVVIGSFENLLESLTLMGLSTVVELLSVREEPANPEISALLGLQPNARVQRATRLRKIEREPFSFLVTHVPSDVAAKFDSSALARRPLLQLLEEAGHKAVEAEQWITAVAASLEVSQPLGLTPGAPLLRIVRVMRDQDGNGIEALEGFYRPERFQHHMKLTRRRSRSGREEWR